MNEHTTNKRKVQKCIAKEKFINVLTNFHIQPFHEKLIYFVFCSSHLPVFLRFRWLSFFSVVLFEMTDTHLIKMIWINKNLLYVLKITRRKFAICIVIFFLFGCCCFIIDKSIVQTSLIYFCLSAQAGLSVTDGFKGLIYSIVNKKNHDIRLIWGKWSIFNLKKKLLIKSNKSTYKKNLS
jgi:hypothetical protein